MKKIFWIATLAWLWVCCPMNLFAQRNIDRQPAWGPIGYERVDYYYLPDLNIYYDVTNALFYFLSGGRWVSAAYLPERYRAFDLYSLYKVVINNERNPWNNNNIHKKKYKNYKKDKTQVPIRFSTDAKYNRSKENVKAWANPPKEPSAKQAPKNSNKTSNKKTPAKNAPNSRDEHKKR